MSPQYANLQEVSVITNIFGLFTGFFTGFSLWSKLKILPCLLILVDLPLVQLNSKHKFSY